MTDISQRTPAEIIDLLITNNIKCFMLQEKIMDTTFSNDERFQASLQAHEFNNRRNQLIRALDKLLGYGEFTQLEKSYNKKFTEEK